jgi:polyribonucleotide nucleotidyltransferase
MWQILGGVTIVLGAACYYFFNENQALRAETDALRFGMAQQEETINALEEARETQTEALDEMRRRSNEIQNEMNRYLDIFARHNLSKLAAAKPGLIEKRVNNGTKQVFDTIENDSRELDRLDDGGVQLAETKTPRSENSNKAGADQNQAAGTAKGN